MQTPSRRAILIGSQAPYVIFVPRIENDISLMESHLQSPNSGVFRTDEIMTLGNPTLEKYDKLPNIFIVN